MNLLAARPIPEKLELLNAGIEQALSGRLHSIPNIPGRDIEVLSVRETRTNKKGLGSPEGLASLLHMTASIELQAMELGYRSLVEYPNAPEPFRLELARVVKEEGLHLSLCLEELDGLGYKWGDFPVNLGLWNAVGADDSFLDRILIVHCFLEGSGLDAQETLLKRLTGIGSNSVSGLMEKIFMDEQNHVHFGISTYQEACQDQGLDPNEDFRTRMDTLFDRLPLRLEKPSRILREKAGFSSSQLDTLDQIRSRQKSF